MMYKTFSDLGDKHNKKFVIEEQMQKNMMPLEMSKLNPFRSISLKNRNYLVLKYDFLSSMTLDLTTN